MIHQKRFIDAVKASGVKNVALIDDAFDPPSVDDDNSGALLEYLEDGANAGFLDALGITPQERQQAIAAINISNFDEPSLLDTVRRLYLSYVDELNAAADPGGIFDQSKSANLAFVRPLLSLLRNCKPALKISLVGSTEADLAMFNGQPDLIFLDYYLNPEILDGDGTKGQKKAGRDTSLARIMELAERFADKAPSVMLMSSRSDVKKEAADFRKDIKGGKVYASRFAFLEKKQLSFTNDGVDIAPEAADALLDIVQSFSFARALYLGLECWSRSSRSAIDELEQHISELDLKDLAYLVRFRLAEEGQGLLEYLEWFFGECLLDGMARAVDSGIAKDPRIKEIDGDSVEQIEGAFDGPTKKIASLYHRVRIQAPRPGRQANYRMGDLYVSPKKKTVAAVVTPDCDLVLRRSGTRNAVRLLTIGGSYQAFESTDVSVSDFMIFKERPYNINWERKDVSAVEFKDWPKPGESSEELVYLGTLRPQYAQSMQRTLLDDLGRIGLSVAPALGMSASAEVWIKDKDGQKKKLTLDGLPKANVFVVPGRSSAQKAQAIFIRRFVSSLLTALIGLPEDKYPKVAGLKKPNAYASLQKMFQGGVQLGQKAGDIRVSASSEPQDKDAWCWIKVALTDDEEPVL
jgi:hypothetical protein